MTEAEQDTAVDNLQVQVLNLEDRMADAEVKIQGLEGRVNRAEVTIQLNQAAASSALAAAVAAIYARFTALNTKMRKVYPSWTNI